MARKRGGDEQVVQVSGVTVTAAGGLGTTTVERAPLPPGAPPPEGEGVRPTASAKPERDEHGILWLTVRVPVIRPRPPVRRIRRVDGDLSQAESQAARDVLDALDIAGIRRAGSNMDVFRYLCHLIESAHRAVDPSITEESRQRGI